MADTSDLETVFDGKITKVVPSLVSEVKEGISLVSHNAGKEMVRNQRPSKRKKET